MKGFVDRFDTTIAGWAYDPEQPNQPIEISVSSDGIEIYRCTADLFRSDLLPALGSGGHGFSFDPENIIQISGKMTLTIEAHGTTSLLLLEDEWIPRKIVGEGQDGWLFLQNDSNDVNERMAGLVGNDMPRIRESAMTFVTRDVMLASLGIAYQAVIIPEKNVVCQKYWPEMIVSPDRPAPTIIRRAKELGCRILYPIENFLENPENFFFKTDTHLNTNGYDRLLDFLSIEMPLFFERSLRAPRKENLSFIGDLGNKLFPKRTEVTHEFVFPASTDYEIVWDSVEKALETGETLRGTTIFVKNRLAPTSRLLLFGTSTGHHFLPSVSQYFKEILFVWENTFDYELIATFKPDCVLWLAAERFLPSACNDMYGLPDTFDEIIRRLKNGSI
jgi:hypothetical protein